MRLTKAVHRAVGVVVAIVFINCAELALHLLFIGVVTRLLAFRSVRTRLALVVHESEGRVLIRCGIVAP